MFYINITGLIFLLLLIGNWKNFKSIEDNRKKKILLLTAVVLFFLLISQYIYHLILKLEISKNESIFNIILGDFLDYLFVIIGSVFILLPVLLFVSTSLKTFSNNNTSVKEVKKQTSKSHLFFKKHPILSAFVITTIFFGTFIIIVLNSDSGSMLDLRWIVAGVLGAFLILNYILIIGIVLYKKFVSKK